MPPARWSVHSTLTASRAYLDLLKGLCLLSWDELGKPNGAELVGVLREKWDADLKAVKGTAAKAQRKVLAQGAELAGLQAAHMRLRKTLTTVQEERDELKKILEECAPTIHAHWMRAKRLLRTKDEAQAEPKFCSDCGWKLDKPDHEPFHSAWIRTAHRRLAIESDPWWCQPCGVIHAPLIHVLATDIPQTHETHGD